MLARGTDPRDGAVLVVVVVVVVVGVLVVEVLVAEGE